jgi:beta-phosphoglucomutase-like phosphatase (HAD superfamily)
MQIVKAVLFEPVGCLAEFPAEEFDAIAARVFHMHGSPTESGSEAYWHLLDLIETAGNKLNASEAQIAEALELHAVDRVEVYEDVSSALSELKAMSIELIIASSLSTAAVSRFLNRFSLKDFFSAVWTRETAGGVKAAPLAKAIESASLPLQHILTLVDTAGGLAVAKEVGTNSMLMINDYDQGRRLAMHAPTGGIISLQELPDLVRLVAEGAKPSRS